MKRQVIIGGAIVVISVASAAAYGIVQSRWFGSATPRSVTATTASTSAPQSGSIAQGTREARPAAPTQSLSALTAPMLPTPQPITVAQAQAPQPPLARPPAMPSQATAAPA